MIARPREFGSRPSSPFEAGNNGTRVGQGRPRAPGGRRGRGDPEGRSADDGGGPGVPFRSIFLEPTVDPEERSERRGVNEVGYYPG